MNEKILVAGLTLLGALIAAGFGAFLQGLRNRHDQIAKALPEFYAAARAAYYAWEDKYNCDEQSKNYQYLHNLEQTRYRELMAALTSLALLVPPSLQARLEKFQDEKWTGINEPTYENERLFKEELHQIRKEVIELNRHWLFEPIWRR